MIQIQKKLVISSVVVLLVLVGVLVYMFSNPKPSQKIIKEDNKEVKELTKEIQELKKQILQLDESINKRDSLILKKEERYDDLKHKANEEVLSVRGSTPDVIDSIIADGIAKRKKKSLLYP